MKKCILGIDIGGTKIECALIKITKSEIEIDAPIEENLSDEFPIELIGLNQCAGEIWYKERIKTDAHIGYENVLMNIANLCRRVCDEVGLDLCELEGIGIGLPGSVHPETQIMLNGNTDIFIGKNLRDDLRTSLDIDLDIKIENDAACFALAEVYCGAGQIFFNEAGILPHDQIGIGVILGTGVGGGIIYKGQNLSGRNGAGGEIGHIEFKTSGKSCYCGRSGCTEQYLSGSAIEKIYYEKFNDKLSSKQIFDLAQRGDQNASDFVNEYKHELARFIMILSNIFDPDYFVLGGGVSIREEIYDDVERIVGDNSFVSNSSPKIYKHAIGDSAGALGAAILLLI